MAEWFALTMNPVELVVRGTAVYLGLVLVVRFVLRRDVSSMRVADLLFIVLVADAAQNAMSAQYRSIGDGAVLLATLISWNVALDWLAYRVPGFRKLIESPAVRLIENGKWIRRNLRKEWITTGEVLAQLRERGIENVSDVRVAYLESDGELSVIPFDRDRLQRRRPSRRGAA